MLGALLLGGCEAGAETAGGGNDKDNHPQKEREIASKTEAPVIGKPSRGPRQIDYDNPTQDDIQVLVRRAVDYYKRNGDYKAFDEFMTNGGQFSAGRTFIFAYDFSGRCLADLGSPTQVGSIVTESGSEAAKEFFHAVAGKAKSGGGWVSARDVLPGGTNVRPKDCYVINVEDKLFIGSGIYHE